MNIEIVNSRNVIFHWISIMNSSTTFMIAYFSRLRFLNTITFITLINLDPPTTQQKLSITFLSTNF